MQYLLLIYDSEKEFGAMSKEKADSILSGYFRFTESIKASGKYVGSNRLQPVANATTVRVRNGKVATTDGPFAETREQLGGYYLIDARDLDEALKIAAQVPSAQTGCIEVRPVWAMNPG